MNVQTDRVYDRAGFGGSVRRGVRPGVLVVDFTCGFTEAQYPTGADMSVAVAATERVLDTARRVGAPVVFTTIEFDDGQVGSLPWLDKSPGLAALRPGSREIQVDERLGRLPTESILVKTGASAFFGTPLATQLAAAAVDTLIVTGATTSGCLRASVVDAVQYGYPVLVPRDCVADRAQAPHEASLFDIEAKYGDVVSLADTLDYLESVVSEDHELASTRT